MLMRPSRHHRELKAERSVRKELIAVFETNTQPKL